MPQQPVSHRDRVYKYLTRQIAEQHYREGAILNERKIAETLGVSRTPVREAIGLLESEGWVTVSPRRGIFVCGLSLRQVDEVFQIRGSLEVLSVRLLLERLTPERLAALRAIVAQQAENASRKEAPVFIQLDRQFHNEIVEGSGNQLLAETLAKLDERLVRIGMQSVRDGTRYGRALREHEKLLAAMAGGHRREAEKAMESHIERTWRNLRKQLTKHSDEGGDSI